ncbi:hypothetical protein K523DRAFT_323916, partial [Schizophyllum commune Tattone D]
MVMGASRRNQHQPALSRMAARAHEAPGEVKVLVFVLFISIIVAVTALYLKN